MNLNQIIILILLFICFNPPSLVAQNKEITRIEKKVLNKDTTSSIVQKDSIKPTSFNKKKFILVAGGKTMFYSGVMFGLYRIWYKDRIKSPFHLVDDSKDWLQIDKFGHGFTCYAIGKASINLLKWSGLSKKKAIWYGSFFGSFLMTSIEILDGHYKNWGASTTDMIANISGGALALVQELAFRDQLINFKFSFFTSDLQQHDPNGLGSHFLESLVQDYNGQTFWLSFNPYTAFKPKNKIPKWLNIAVGYSAYGMFGAERNPIYKANGERFPKVDRYRRFYLSLDINFEKIPTQSKVLKTMFYVLNHVKVPLPTLELNTQGNLIFHPIYF